MAGKAKGTKKGRKIGRHKTRRPSAKAYTIQQRWIKNKAKKMAKHLKKHPNDKGCVLGKVVDYRLVKVGGGKR